MGEIPVLEAAGIRLAQTAPILLRLSERFGKFGGENDGERFAILRRRRDDFLGIFDARRRDRSFVIGERPRVADLSMVGYLLFPKHEAGYDFSATHPAVESWLARIAALPGRRPPYELLPGKPMSCYR